MVGSDIVYTSHFSFIRRKAAIRLYLLSRFVYFVFQFQVHGIGRRNTIYDIMNSVKFSISLFSRIDYIEWNTQFRSICSIDLINARTISTCDSNWKRTKVQQFNKNRVDVNERTFMKSTAKINFKLDTILFVTRNQSIYKAKQTHNRFVYRQTFFFSCERSKFFTWMCVCVCVL